MSSKKSERRAARKEMVRQAELARQAKENTPMHKMARFFGWATLAVFTGGLFISVICSFLIYRFNFGAAMLCSIYAAAICINIWIAIPCDDESEDVKRAKLLKEAKEEDAVSGSLKAIFGGLIVTLIGVAHLCFAIFTDSLKIDAEHLTGLVCLLGTIAWGMLGLRVVFTCIGCLFSYKKVLAEEAAGVRFVELPPDEDEEELERIIAERMGDVPFNTDSHPNNMDAENDYIDDPDYDYGSINNNDRSVPTFALDSRPNNFDAENSYIDDPDYDRGQSRYNCHRSPAPKKNSRRSSNYSSADDSFYDEVQY